MAQTSKGARKAVRRNLKKDPDFYKKLGQRNKGVKKSAPPYFAVLAQTNPELHRELSAQGGARNE